MTSSIASSLDVRLRGLAGTFKQRVSTRVHIATVVKPHQITMIPIGVGSSIGIHSRLPVSLARVAICWTIPVQAHGGGRLASDDTGFDALLIERPGVFVFRTESRQVFLVGAAA